MKYSVERNLVFERHSGLNLKGDFYRPHTPEKVPVVLVLHGGGWRRRDGDMSSICRQLARNGFAAFNSTYRLGPKNPYPAPFDDVKSALQFLKTNADKFRIDQAKIYMWGYSAGGHLALVTGLDPDHGIKGIVAGAAPTSLTSYPGSFLIRDFIGKPYSEARELWASVSPVNCVSEKSPPVFLYHGVKDWLVGIDQMRLMKKALQKKCVRVEALEVQNLGHIGVYLFSKKSIHEGITFLKGV